MKTPLYCLPPLPFFQFCPTPPPLLFLLSCFFGWMSDHATFDVLFYLMITWIYTCRALVLQYQKDLDVCFLQQGIKFTEVWHIMCFLLVLWFDITHTNTQTHTAHSGASRLAHPYKCIFTPSVMCSQQLLYYIKWLNE